jgi:hypothetical protein
MRANIEHRFDQLRSLLDRQTQLNSPPALGSPDMSAARALAKRAVTSHPTVQRLVDRSLHQMKRRLTPGHVDNWTAPPWGRDGPEPVFPGVVCQACTDNQMRIAPYRIWGERLATPDVYVHRKQWEWFYICQALYERNVLVPGARGIGFGVGTEPLTAWIAAQGCSVMATDYPEGEHAADWSSTGELAYSVGDLNSAGICPPDDFAARVTYQPVDMRDLSGLHGPFDFAWSSCAVEHLGSIEATLTFLVDHLALLAPGAISVHTTELNLSSLTDTVDHAPTVLLRQGDFYELQRRLRGVGELAPFNWNTGDNPNDRFVAQDASANTQLRFRVDDHVTTSFGIIITKH